MGKYKVVPMTKEVDEKPDPIFATLMEGRMNEIYSLSVMAAACRSPEAPTSSLVVIHRSSEAWSDANEVAKDFERMGENVIALVRSCETAGELLTAVGFVEGAQSVLASPCKGHLPIAVLTGASMVVCYVEEADAKDDIETARKHVQSAKRNVS